MGRGKPRVIYAPWSPQVVEALNAWQVDPRAHAYTCGAAGPHPSGKLLVATADGWECPSCDYRQTWAHDPGNPRPPREGERY